MAVSVLVTGAAGALGREIVRALSVGHEVIRCGRVLGRDVDAQWDLTRQDAPQPNHGSTVVVHAAALRGGYQQSVDRAECLFDVNVTGTFRVARWCISQRVNRLILISGAIVYGEWEQYPKSESDEANPWRAGAYAVSKWCSEQVARLVKDCGVELTILRFSSLYGSGYRDGLPQRLLRQGKREGIIVVDPPLEDAFDLLHVSDAARTVRRAVDSHQAELWNVGGGNLTTIGELARHCGELVASEVQVSDSKAKHPPRIVNWVDDRRSRRELRHANEVSLRQGLSEIARSM